MIRGTILISESAYFSVPLCICQECSGSLTDQSCLPLFYPPLSSEPTNSLGTSCSQSPSTSLPADIPPPYLLSASSTHLHASKAVLSSPSPTFIQSLSILFASSLLLRTLLFQLLSLLQVFFPFQAAAKV